MALRKIIIAVDCENDRERDEIQKICTEISSMGMLKASQILTMAPAFQRNREDLLRLFHMITTGGVKSLMSVDGGRLLLKLSKAR